MAKAKASPKSNQYPTNLSFSKSISPSLGVFWTFDSQSPNDRSLLNIREETSIGTISNYKDIVKDGGKNVGGSNPQTVDVCYAPIIHDSIALTFTVAFCGLSRRPHACNEMWFIDKTSEITSQYAKIGGYRYLADLYLKNIFEAKMLWRNGFADDIAVNVCGLRTGIAAVTDINSEDYKLLLDRVAGALAGDDKRVVLKVEITGWVGNGQEVYPSQEFVQKTNDKFEKSKTLARTEVGDDTDVAAMHAQKIGNAIRQIDFWYDGFAAKNKPLAIDPACVDKSEMKAYRLKNTGRDLFTLLEHKLFDFCEEIKTQTIGEVDDDVHFIVANLIRGGVYGGAK